MKIEHWAVGIAILAALATSSVWSSLTILWEGIGYPALLLLTSVVWPGFDWVLSANLGESWTVKLLPALVVFGRCHL